MYSYVAVAAKGGAGGDSGILMSKKFLMSMYQNVTCTNAEFEEGRGRNFQSAEMPRDAKVVSTMAPAALFVWPDDDSMIHTGSARLYGRNMRITAGLGPPVMHQFRRLPLARGWNVYRGGALQRQRRGGRYTRTHTAAEKKNDKCTAVVDQVKSVEAVSLLKQFV